MASLDKTVQQISVSVMSPGAVAVGGGGAETPAVCCVPPECACGPPSGPCVVAAALPLLEDRPHPGGWRGPLTPRGFQQGPLVGRAVPLTVHTPSAGSWKIRIRNRDQEMIQKTHISYIILFLLYHF